MRAKFLPSSSKLCPENEIHAFSHFGCYVSSSLSSYWLFLPQKYGHCPFQRSFYSIFSHRIFSGFIGPAYAGFSSAFSVSFRTHFLAQRRQTRVKKRSLFIMPSFALVLMLHSDSLRCFCSLLVVKHAEFLLRPIGLYTGNSRLPRQRIRSSRFICAPSYRYNDITILIIDKQFTQKIRHSNSQL